MKEKVLQCLALLPHSAGRVPYTYHHDYFRTHVEGFLYLSRSEVAQATAHHTEDQLYATALCQLLNELDCAAILEIESPTNFLFLQTTYLEATAALQILCTSPTNQ